MTGPDKPTQRILLKAPIGYIAVGDRCTPLAAMTQSGAMRMVAANLMRMGGMSGVPAPSILTSVAVGRSSVTPGEYDKFTLAIQPYIDDVTRVSGAAIGYGLPRMTNVYGSSLAGDVYFGLIESDVGTHTTAGARKEDVTAWAEQVAKEILNRHDIDGPTAIRLFASASEDNYINIARVEPSSSLKTTLAVASLSEPDTKHPDVSASIQPAM